MRGTIRYLRCMRYTMFGPGPDRDCDAARWLETLQSKVRGRHSIPAAFPPLCAVLRFGLPLSGAAILMVATHIDVASAHDISQQVLAYGRSCNLWYQHTVRYYQPDMAFSVPVYGVVWYQCASLQRCARDAMSGADMVRFGAVRHGEASGESDDDKHGREEIRVASSLSSYFFARRCVVLT
eukprot:1539752-Rhodomonas_salina.3